MKTLRALWKFADDFLYYRRRGYSITASWHFAKITL